MSSPAGLRFSRADFLARWTPSSTRAGVILSPGPPDVAASLGLAALEPDDSFGSDFAPLPGSADSSCLGGGDGPARSPGGEQARDEGPVSRLSYEPSRPPQGRVDRLEGMADKAQDLPVMVKLDQLRKWQQHMQEQLKAHQLEELLRLQEEQQRLLGKMTGSQHGTGETSCLSGAEWEDDSVQGAGDYTDTPDSPLVTCPGVPPGASCGPREDRGPSPAQSQERLPRGPGHPELEDSWLSRGDDEERDDTLTPGDGVAPTGDDSRDEVFYERPIKPGIGGQTKTFEELLEEQLRVEEQRMKSARQQQSQDGGDAARAPKQPFLKRGDGLSRFSNTRKASLPKPGLKKVQTRVISRSHSEPAALQRGNILQRLPVQRKTATLNKENRLRGVSSPPQDVRAETKAPQMKVLGSHQRHNTPEPIQTDTDGRKTKPPPPRLVKEQNNRKGGLAAQVARNASANRQQNPVGVSRGPEKAQHAATAAERWRGSTGGDGVPQEEASFQELRRWDCERRLESMELGEFELLEQAAEELSFSSNSSFVIKVLQMDQHHRGLHPRRLSSTPIKSTPMGAGECSSDGGSLNSVKTRDDALEDEEEQETHGDHDEVSSRGGSEVEDQDVAVRPPSFPSILCFPAHTNPPYDKRSYQDEDSCRGSASDGESTLMEEDGHQGRVVFDDDDTWNDLEDAVDGAANGSRAVSPDDEVTLPGRTLVKKGSNVVDLDQDMDQDTGPPPASQLMTRLFPSLKPKTQNAPLPPSPPHAAASESKKSEETTGQQVQSRQLRERLVELEIEIQRFKKENAALAALRRDNEETQQQLRKERSAFEQLKTEELAKFEEHKREENRKLQKERKLFERHAAAARAVPDKKEREEIQALKQQLSSLQEELRGREGRWASSHSRLRQQVDSLSQENASLRDEIRVLEKLRLSTLKKTAIITDDETKDGRSARDNSARDNSARENSVSSVAKGVKFASPLDSRGGTSSNSPPQSNAAAASTRSSKGASGMKSSLRRSSGPPSSSSSSLPGRRTEDSRNQDKPPHQDSHDSSPKGGFLTGEAEEREPTEEVVCPPDGKVETVLAGGDRLIVFNNGTKKEVSADGLTVKVTFFNGDTKEVTADQRVIYFYADAKTTHITYPDGMEVLHFPNNQTEKLFPDGRKEITFPDQTVKNLFPGGGEESVLTDGTIIRVNPDATKEILFNTGQKEIHTADYKRREYPDGTVKTVYADGRQETRYPTGRLRIKDRDGNVLLDNGA